MNIPSITTATAENLPSSGGGTGPPQSSGVQQGAHETTPPQAMDNAQMQRMAEEIQERLGVMNISVNFSTYGKHNERVAITVSDQTTGKVIREIPPKELQQLYVKMNELIGLIFNGSA